MSPNGELLQLTVWHDGALSFRRLFSLVNVQLLVSVGGGKADGLRIEASAVVSALMRSFDTTYLFSHLHVDEHGQGSTTEPSASSRGFPQATRYEGGA